MSVADTSGWVVYGRMPVGCSTQHHMCHGHFANIESSLSSKHIAGPVIPLSPGYRPWRQKHSDAYPDSRYALSKVHAGTVCAVYNSTVVSVTLFAGGVE